MADGLIARLRVAVVGGGYAGMAAGVELADRGAQVTIFEAANVLGGRARRVEVDGRTLDNGLHILIGAYTETLRLIERTRAPGEEPGLARLPLELAVHPGFRLRAPRLPAPLHLGIALILATGLRWRERLAAAKFMLAMRRRAFRIERDTTVSALLLEQRQPERVRRLLWEPLCISALNTRPDEASARVFLCVLRDSLSGPRQASDLLLPTTDFSTLLPERAARHVQSRDGSVRLRTTVESFRRTEHGFEIAPGSQAFDRIVLAVSPHRVAALLAGHAELDGLRALVEALRYQPIYSVYLQYPPGTRLPFRMGGIEATYSQWLFDRGQLCGQDGLLGVVISAEGAHRELPQAALARAVHEEIRALVPGLAEPVWHRVIAEKRATFACTPDLRRPGNATPIAGLYLAGDYTASDYPATLEAAVRSGLAAARLTLTP
jgi:squalene-associated FAD-dependent desaturase